MDKPPCQKRRLDIYAARTLLTLILVRPFRSKRRREKRYYFCHECSAYHLTSQPKRKKQQAA